jgi:hypothetical protein
MMLPPPPLSFVAGRAVWRPMLRAGLVAGLAAAFAATGIAQTPPDAAPRSAFVPLAASTAGSASVLATPVTLSVTDATLSDIVSMIARQAGVSLTYDASLPGLDRKVSLTLTRIAAAQAIVQVLDRSPVQAMVSPSGQVVLVPRSGGRAGVVDGAVRDAITAAPVAGARVELVGTRFATVSRDDGAFSLGRVPAGAYIARVTRLGFRPADVPRLVVADDAPAPVLDVPLERAPITLAEMVVTPGYFGMMQPGLGVPQTMSRQRIENVPQIGEDIYRAVNRLPGVTSTDFSADFFVRGGSSSELYVTLDGLELIEPFHLKDIGGGLSIIDSRAIGGVELTTGGFSAEYGDRLTAAISISRSSSRAPGTRSTRTTTTCSARRNTTWVAPAACPCTSSTPAMPSGISTRRIRVSGAATAAPMGG